ncbi:MAG TPA: TolC family protein [Thermoanaerobaculia bacterium]|nr:TolC family protein [Thermoanaerobaculia bacterium]
MNRLASAVLILIGALLLPFATGCASLGPTRDVSDSVSPAPGAPWQPPSEGRPPQKQPAAPAPEIPERFRRGATLALSEIVDLALRNSPVTRAAWFDAQTAAAEVGSKRSEYFPSLELDGNYTRQKTAALGGRSIFISTSYGPSLSLSWLLLDFGGRQADVEEAQRALFAADWTHNAAIQDLILQVENAYYQYLNAKALRAAQQSSVASAKESLSAAEARHRAGVATIADVLQAKTAFSQAELSLETVEGQIQTIRGALATALGVPANIPVEVGELPENIRFEEVGQTVDQLIERAAADRPDLAAARFRVLEAESHVRSVRAEGLPSLLASGTLGRTYFYNSSVPYSNTYSGAILFRFPVFAGYRNSYDTLKAREEAQAAKSRADSLENQVVFQVWSSYYGVKTATQRVKTAGDLLASARQSQDVALGRYKEGVGSILDLLTAQSAFASARAQEVQTRADWFLAMAQLAHDTGGLAPAPGKPAGSSPAADGEKP